MVSQFHLLLTRIFLGAVVILATALLGCEESEKTDPVVREPRPKNLKPIDPTTTGTLAGTVHFQGTPREGRKFTMGSSPGCARLHDKPVLVQKVRVADGKLQDVLVYVKKGTRKWKVPDPPQNPVEVNQVGCVFEPRIAVARVGQEVVFINSDALTHNVNIRGKKNSTFNRSMTTAGQSFSRVFRKPEIMITTLCDVHPWMVAKLGVLDHPFFQLTGADGAFSLSGLPPGDYEVEAWHEVHGTKTQKVTLAASGAVTLDFSF
jgi:plastocyanin